MAGKNKTVELVCYKPVAGPLTAMAFRNFNHQRKQERAQVLLRKLKLTQKSKKESGSKEVI